MRLDHNQTGVCFRRTADKEWWHWLLSTIKMRFPHKLFFSNHKVE